MPYIAFQNTTASPSVTASPSTTAPPETTESPETEETPDTTDSPETTAFIPQYPAGSWDSHMHVVEPDRFPLSTNAAYKPAIHTLSDALTFESSLGINNVVLVQPSIYGNDNACLLAALKELGPQRARGVVQFDPSSTDSQTLRQWHDLGVRGVRINLKSVGSEPSAEQLAQTLNLYADKIRPLGWVIDIYIAMNMIPMLENVVPKLGVKVCLDHYGSPNFPQSSIFLQNPQPRGLLDAYRLPGFSSLMSLLRQGNTWVKLSAPYRLSPDPNMRDLGTLTTRLRKAAPTRLVYATDWPHTRFSGVDARPFMEACLKWCRTQEAADRIFQKNAEELWDVQ